MVKIPVKIKKSENRSYNILIEKGIIKKIPEYLKKHKIGKKYGIITDSKTQKLFGKKFVNGLKRKGIKYELFSFKQGETSKTLKTVEKLAEEMIEKGIDRKDAIIALGGGVVGDIAGFLASIYMRGIPYIQVPTTLMAMVDSSIGGKTGVDLRVGKNLVGTLTQPKAIFMDINYLKTLPPKQMKSGLAEVIKYGVITSKRLFNFIEHNIDKILTHDEETLKYIVEKSAKAKAKVVMQDETEKGSRMILNYGHTYGHALEKISGYKLLHGYAISIGMVIANKIAVEKGYLKQKHADRVKKLFKSVGLPTTTMKKPTTKDLLSDKKKDGNYINFVFATKIGKAIIHKEKCK